MARIFISYRRADSADILGRIYENLLQTFNEDDIFRDIDDIHLGADFPETLRQAIEDCEVMLVLIGPVWATIANSGGQKRLFDDDDWVRQEVEMGLRLPSKTVIPVLVKGAYMPSSGELPTSLQDLPRQNGIPVRNDPDLKINPWGAVGPCTLHLGYCSHLSV